MTPSFHAEQNVSRRNGASVHCFRAGSMRGGAQRAFPAGRSSLRAGRDRFAQSNLSFVLAAFRSDPLLRGVFNEAVSSTLADRLSFCLQQ